MNIHRSTVSLWICPTHHMILDFVVVKKSWRGCYDRIIRIESSSLRTIQPSNGKVTNFFRLEDLTSVERSGTIILMTFSSTGCSMFPAKLHLSCSSVEDAETFCSVLEKITKMTAKTGNLTSSMSKTAQYEQTLPSIVGAMGAIVETVSDSDVIDDNGIVGTVVQLLKIGLSTDMQVAVCDLLVQLMVASSFGAESARDAGAVPILVSMIDVAPDSPIATSAAAVLCRLTSDQEDDGTTIRDAGGIQTLLGLLDGGRSNKAAIHAISALKCLAVNPANTRVIRESDGAL